MNDKIRNILIIIKKIIIFMSGIHTFAIACAASSNGYIDIIGFISLLICSLYTLEKNKKS